MKKVRMEAAEGATCALVAQVIPWQPIVHQLVLFVQMQVIIILGVVLGSIAISLLPGVGRLAHQLWLYPSRRRTVSRWSRAQRIAELEAANGYGVVWKGTCPSCRAPLVMHAQHCSHCGRQISVDGREQVLVCQECHETNPAGGRFCTHCGHQLRRPVP